MKKIFTTLFVITGLFISLNNASASSYVLNNSSVDNLFASATELNINSISLDGVNAMDLPANGATFASDKNPIVARSFSFFSWWMGYSQILFRH